MSKIYEHYENNTQCCWYDSSNIIFSKCYDKGDTVNLKIVFKRGATYLYRDVNKNDYLIFRDSQSNGSVFNKHIKQYPYTILSDTNLDELNEMKECFIEEDNAKDISQTSDVDYKIKFVDKTGEFSLLNKDGKVIYHGFENNVSITALFLAMNIPCNLESVEFIDFKTDEDENGIDTSLK